MFYVLSLTLLDQSIQHGITSDQAAIDLTFTHSALTSFLHPTPCITDKSDPFPRSLVKHSGFNEDQVRQCAEEMVTLHTNAPTGSLNAVYKKYSHAK